MNDMVDVEFSNFCDDGAIEAYPLFQVEDGGSQPTSSLHLKSFRVEPCDITKVRNFIEKWHYSKNTNGIRSRYCFRLMNGSKMVGAAIFGGLAMANQWKKYAKSEDGVLELRRLCCIDDTPQNTESYFIGKMLKMLRRHTSADVVISYADMAYGHSGIIYKASNFQCIGETAPSSVIIYQGKRYHDKCIRAKYRGRIKPFAANIKAALDRGDAKIQKTPGKIIYCYRLRQERQRPIMPIQRFLFD
jgi:hypothetical protein